MKIKLFSLLFLPAFLVWSGAAAAAEPSPEEVMKAVVKIRAAVPQEAASAERLGTERQGSGAVIDRQGHIVTSGTLIADAERIEVIGAGGEVVAATVAGYDHRTGVAILQSAEPLPVTPLKIGPSSRIEDGEPLLVLGSKGRDSAGMARVITRQEFAGDSEYLLEDAIFTIPAYPGIAGAALISSEGHLVGIGAFHSQFSLPGIGVVPGNIFIPIDVFRPVLAVLKSRGCLSDPAPWVGVSSEEANGRVIVTEVVSGSPAEKAGLKHGDVILAVNGQGVTGLADFYRKIWGSGSAGIEIPLRILQGDQIRTIEVASQEGNGLLAKTGNIKLCSLEMEKKTF